MKRKLRVKKLLNDAYCYINTYGDIETCMVLLRRAIEEVDKESQRRRSSWRRQVRDGERLASKVERQ